MPDLPLAAASRQVLRQLSSFPLGYRKLFQCDFCTGTTCAPSEPAVAKHTDWLNNVQVARLVMGCHECIRACLACFCAFLPSTARNLHRRRKVVTWSRPRTKILPAASRGQWLTPARFLMVTRPFKNLKSRVSSLQIPSQYWGIAFEALLKPTSNWLQVPSQYWGIVFEALLKPTLNWLQTPSQYWGIVFEALLELASDWLQMPSQYWSRKMPTESSHLRICLKPCLK